MIILFKPSYQLLSCKPYQFCTMKPQNSLLYSSREYTSIITSSIVREILKVFFSRIKKNYFLQDNKLVSLSKIVFYFNNTKIKGLLKLGINYKDSCNTVIEEFTNNILIPNYLKIS